MTIIQPSTVTSTIDALKEKYPSYDAMLIERGVGNAAKFWTEQDGSNEDFIAFCCDNFAGSSKEKDALYTTIDRNLETLFGSYDSVNYGLKRPIDVREGEITKIDEIFGAFSPSAHFAEDMYSTKIAFVTLLNFPFYSLEEKNSLGKDWTSKEWAYARLGDLFDSRVPASHSQELSVMGSRADSYIASYNIMMDKLRSEDGEQLFADNMALISHWGLRDEIKSNYSNSDGRGLEKQRMIYNIMEHIINQTIPSQVISNSEYEWRPISNTIFKGGESCEVTPEPNTRYEMLHAIGNGQISIDKYCPTYPTYLERAFNDRMQLSDKEIEEMFTEFISSAEVAMAAELIKSRLNRDLEPFDIWYDGFKKRSTLNEDLLSEKLKKMYPTPLALEKGLPAILAKLDFDREKAAEICSKIKVDPSRGAGHAWGASSKENNSYLRSRIGDDGLDYKGYNIGVHEFGHNVEQTITANDVEYYSMRSVPSTAFTEALAFIFQTRDLIILGEDVATPQSRALNTLDIFWNCYEIMGVSLVDIYTWRWWYENKDATALQLKDQIIKIAKEVWNKYYYPILGTKDSPILATYSHMISIPLYLPNYPYGHIVESQLESHLEGKSIGDEVCRIYSVGKLTPNLWMEHATGSKVTTAPLLKDTNLAIKQL